MKTRNFLTKLAILCAGYGMFSDAVVIPLVTLIFGEYPDTSAFVMNFILSGPALIAIPVSLITGKLAQYISKKDILITAFILYIVGGVGGAFTQSMGYLAVMRGICGAAAGLIGVVAYGYIAELYTDIKERGTVMGWYSAMSAVFGIAMTFFAGLIAMTSWRNAFYINGFSIFSLLLVVFFLPRTKPEGKKKDCVVDKMEEKKCEEKKYPISQMVVLLSAFFVMGAFYCVIYYTIDIYISEVITADSSVLSGTITAIGTIASFLIGVTFGKIYIRTRRYMPVIFFLGCGLSFVVLTYTSSSIILGIAASIAGASYGMSLSYYAMIISEIVPPSKMSISMAYYQVVFNISIFAAPYLPMLVLMLTKGTTYASTYVYTGGILVVGGIISLILALKKNEITAVQEDVSLVNE